MLLVAALRRLAAVAPLAAERRLQGVWVQQLWHMGLSCPAECEIVPDQGSSLCALRCQADSQPLEHQGSPAAYLLLWASQSLAHSVLEAFLLCKL